MRPTTSDHNLELINACKSGNIEAVGRALDSGADVNFVFRQEGEIEGLVLCPLVIVCKNACTDIVELLLTREDIKINLNDDMMDAPIVYAVKNGNIEIADILLKKGADIDIKRWDDSSESPLLEAAKANNEDMFKFLVNKGADLDYAMKQKDKFPIGVEMKDEITRAYEVAKFVKEQNRRSGTQIKSVLQLLYDASLGRKR